jgi:TonB family protein
MVRPRVPFRPILFVAVALTWSAGLGCASDKADRRDQAREAREAARAARPSHVQQAQYAEDEGSPQMTVTGEEGTLNAADVESALHDHSTEIRDCYRLGRRSPRMGGRLVLRFFVDGKGEVDDVAIVESSIGNHAIERCIADIGLGVVFEQPAGHKPATFDYPVEFRPARQLTADRQRNP